MKLQARNRNAKSVNVKSKAKAAAPEPVKKPSKKKTTAKVVPIKAAKPKAAPAKKATQKKPKMTEQKASRGRKMQTQTNVVEIKPKASLPRKRLHKGPLNPEIQKKMKTSWESYRAREIKRNLEAKGTPLGTVTVAVKEQRLLALQVRSDRDPEWGTLKSIPINEYTPDAELKKHYRYLNDLKIGWIISNYFDGTGVEFRICEITQKGYKTSY